MRPVKFTALVFVALVTVINLCAVKAYAIPCAGLSMITGRDTVCAGDAINLSDSTVGGVWSSSDTAKAIVNPYTGLVTGVYGGSATITYATSPTCYVTKMVVINALLPIIGDTSVCAGSSTFFSDLTPGGAWSINNISVATINPSTGVAYGLASGITVVTYTLPNGCTRKQILQVIGLPLNYYVFGGGIYCEGTAGVTIGLNGSDTEINYKLYRNDTAVGDSLNGTGGAIFFGPIAPTGMYTIVGMNVRTGCSKQMSNVAVVGTTPANVPSVSITSSTGNDTVCLLAAATYSAVPVNGGPSPSYQWYVNGASAGTGPTYSYMPSNGDEISVTLFSTAVCALPGTADTSMIVSIIPRVSPTVSIYVLPSDTVCLFTPVTLEAASVYGGPSPVYRWMKNGISSAVGSSYTYLPEDGDHILAVIKSDYQCLNVDSAYSNIENITVQPLLIPTVSVTAHPGTTIGVGQYDTLVVTVLNGGTALHYQWEINSSAVPGATNDTFVSNTIADQDTVTCVVTSAEFCGGLPASAGLVITDTLIPTVYVSDIRSFENLRLAPNPNSGTFNIEGTLGGDVPAAKIDVTDVLGQLVYTLTEPMQKGLLKAKVSLDAGLTNGVYFVRISAGGAAAVKRFVLSR